MSVLNEAQKKRLRGKILELVLEGHDLQLSRYDDTSLWGMIKDLGWVDISQNNVLTCCQDLKDRNFLTFNHWRDPRNGDVVLSRIEILPAGRDLMEMREKTDPAVTKVR